MIADGVLVAVLVFVEKRSRVYGHEPTSFKPMNHKANFFGLHIPFAQRRLSQQFL